MSFILDALKKSQAEQNAELAALGYAQANARTGLQPWLIGVLILVLVGNAGVLVWVLLDRTSPETPAVAESPIAPATPPPVIAPAPIPPRQSAPARVARVEQAPNPAPIVIRPQTSTNTTTSNNDTITDIVIQPGSSGSGTDDESNLAEVIEFAPSEQGAEPLVIAPKGDSPNSIADNKPTQPVASTKLQDLPPAQQLRYNALEYSAHTFFVDDPNDSFLVVNGDRLNVGDKVLGLTVHSLTVDGVVFAEPTPDGVRYVEVSVLEQWARAR